MRDQSTAALENTKIAVALRTARTAIGWNQQEFAERLNVAKSTIARIETLETAASAAVLMRAMELLREAGVTIDMLSGPGISFHVSADAINEAARRLQDDQKRRPDRKKNKGAEKPELPME
jgi:transcriptional regulator with XRE-family HTH domain